MVDRRTLWLLLPEPVRRLPADLATMLLLTVLVNLAVFTPGLRETGVRIPLGLAFVLFVPGYVFIAALFPEAGDPPPAAESDASPADDVDGAGFLEGQFRSGIDGIERVALSFGLSIAIVPLIGLILNFTPWGIRLAPIMAALSGFVLGATIIAAVRRWRLPAEERFAVPYRAWYRAGKAEVFQPETRLDGVLNVLVALSLLLAVGAVGYAVMVPPDGERFSELYILTEGDDGEYVAADYPTEFVQGESEEIVLGVGNQEHRTVEYTVVVLEQETAPDGNTTTVTDQRELDRFETELAHNDTWLHHHDLEPTIVDDDVRIVWLLFLDDEEIPEEPTMDDTEYSVHLWVDVEAADEG